MFYCYPDSSVWMNIRARKMSGSATAICNCDVSADADPSAHKMNCPVWETHLRYIVILHKMIAQPNALSFQPK